LNAAKILTLILTFSFLNIYSQKSEYPEKTLENGWYELNSSKSGITKTEKKTGIKYYLNFEPIVKTENFESFEEFENYQKEKGISIKLDKNGTEKWKIATRNSIGSNLVFILKNEIFCIQKVNFEITAGICAFWKNQQTEKEWDNFKKIFK